MKKTIKSEYLSRVEGEGGLAIEIVDGKIARLQMKIFEAPRFFESFLIGRSYTDVPDFTSRICGICPAAYLMSSVHPIEEIFEIEIDNSIRSLRRLLYASEWLSSHALHVYMLHGPDFYGIESAWASRDYLDIAKRGLDFKKLGNKITSIIGGRSVHPISVRIGGFYKLPDKGELKALILELENAYENSLEGIKWASGLDFKDMASDMEYVSLRHPNEYPMNEGFVVSNEGIEMQMSRFFDSIQEYQVDYSTSLHAAIKRDNTLTPYLTGPISRVNLNYDRLPPEISQIIKECAINIPIKNIQMGIIARSIEISYAIHEALRIIKSYEEPEMPCKDFSLQAGKATWITEAPRGMLIHHYELDEKGIVQKCVIIPPTTQNLFHIEKTIYQFVQANLDSPVDYLKRECEKIIRSYDPCISCATHVVIL